MITRGNCYNSPNVPSKYYGQRLDDDYCTCSYKHPVTMQLPKPNFHLKKWYKFILKWLVYGMILPCFTIVYHSSRCFNMFHRVLPTFITGWWFQVSTHLKSISQLGSLFPTQWKNQIQVPNQQPDYDHSQYVEE